MGVVYRATDTRLGRDVALKFPVESILNSPRMMDAFDREARAAAALNHPNICTVHCVGEQDGRPFIAMELLEGETLEAILNRRELGIEEVVSIASQLAAAIEAAHSRGIVHRDIKPANGCVASAAECESGSNLGVRDRDYAAPSKASNSQACPCRLWRVIPSTCPFRIMFAASIP